MPKISQLREATSTNATDLILLSQGTSNKKIQLSTFLSHLDSSVTFNSQGSNINLTINGLSPNLLTAVSSTNSIGIRTASPTGAALQVLGDVRVGGNQNTAKNIATSAGSVTIGASNSGGAGKKLVTVTTTTAHTFLANDYVTISGVGHVDIDKTQKISTVPTGSTFTFTILNGSTATTSAPSSATVTKTTYYPGLYKSSKNLHYVTADDASTLQPIDVSYGITAIEIETNTTFSLGSAQDAQEKKIYLKGAATGTKAIISNINGLGFNRVELTTPGAGLVLVYDNNKWVCLGVNNALITTV